MPTLSIRNWNPVKLGGGQDRPVGADRFVTLEATDDVLIHFDKRTMTLWREALSASPVWSYYRLGHG